MISSIILGTAAGLAMLSAFVCTKRTKALMSTAQDTAHALFPKVIVVLLIVAHFSELLHAVTHLSWVHVTIALFLLVAWRATVSEPEAELY